MKILYVNTLYSPDIGGGAEITLQKLVEGMQIKGHSVEVLALGPKRGLHVDYVNGVKVTRVGYKNIYWHHSNRGKHPLLRFIWHFIDIYNPFLLKTVVSLIVESKPDVVSIHNMVGWSSILWKAVAITKIPSVQVLHDMYNICPSSNMFSRGSNCERQCLKCKIMRHYHIAASSRVDAVVGVSNYILQRHLKSNLFSGSGSKISIHNSRTRIDAETIPILSNPDSIRFGYIGNLSEIKGVEYLIQQFIAANIQGATLAIAGAGEADYVEYLRSISDSRIAFLGYVNSVEFYPSIDVLVVPSLWQEPLGMIIPEAYIHGRPVIASKRGGIPEMVVDGVTGYLFDPDDVNRLKEILIHVSRNGSVLKSLAKNARTESAKYTDIDRWIEQYTNLYQEVLN